jgi:hypothetical protein
MIDSIVLVSSQWASECCCQLITFLCVQLALSCYLFAVTSLISSPFPPLPLLKGLSHVSCLPIWSLPCSGTRAVCWAEKAQPHSGFKVQHRHTWNSISVLLFELCKMKNYVWISPTGLLRKAVFTVCQYWILVTYGPLWNVMRHLICIQYYYIFGN